MKIEAMNTDIMQFADYLRETGRAEHTVNAYCYSVWKCRKTYGDFTWESLHAYKENLIRKYKPRTINQRLCGINTWLKYSKSTIPQLSQVKVQQASYLENVISDDEYSDFKNALAGEEHWTYYFLVHYMASTGMRVSEVRLLTVEDVNRSYKDLVSKGGKSRRIYIPDTLRSETLKWLSNAGITHGFIFRNKRGGQITDSGIRKQLRTYAIQCGISPEVVYPHSFRHHFAKTFLTNYPDISLLADLLGHTNIETTRIYLKRTSTEQKNLINKIVTW